jgi:glycerol-3-phosphate acyltransferase PlsY
VEILIIVFAYLLGSVPTGYILGQLSGVDIRKAGSGNVGATNVARVVGKWQGILTLLADAAKGLIPVTIALQLGLNATVTAIAALAVFLGHLYPVFLKFQGGKGVATAFGAFLGLAPMATLILLLIFAATVWRSRVVSLSSLIAAVAAPIVLWWFFYSPALVATSAFIALMIIVRHRANIRRLLDGTEPKLGSSSQ